MFRYDITDPKQLVSFVRAVTNPNPLAPERVALEEELLRDGSVTIADVGAYRAALAAAHQAGVISDEQWRAVKSWLLNLVKRQAMPDRPAALSIPRGMSRA